jgi:pyruvate/2-oxoglutarate/acetoin dehydrogenase E1 component/TPP-dependent pyruvate/acetoin dehydrogenase alpha subunit
VASIIASPYEAAAPSSVSKFSKEAVLRDYQLAVRSRHASLIGRQEVLSGRAKFGIFGDGKEVAQLALAYAFRKGDFRSGYYRDQTLMFALGIITLEQFFAELYAHADLRFEPGFGGRAMTGHFATRLLYDDASWRNLLSSYNSAADLSPTASQMPRLVGLAYASKLYRELAELADCSAGFSDRGNEIVFGTIGNAACAEGLFWESVNAIGVLQVPALISIWDDGYGISVPNDLQITKGDVSQLLLGFQDELGCKAGVRLYEAPGWDYRRLCDTYIQVAESVRITHTPAIVHVTELTQPLGHSTSGSHERYKPSARLAWEKEFDCLRRMRLWILAESIAGPGELNRLDEEARQEVLAARDRAWEAFRAPIVEERNELLALLESAQASCPAASLAAARSALERNRHLLRRDLMSAAEEALIALRDAAPSVRVPLIEWKSERERENQERYDSELYSASAESALHVEQVPARYSEHSPTQYGFQILNACFDAALSRYPQLVALGEDIGVLGDVNQGMAKLQAKYGGLRVTDTGIREATILGQAIGMALRGLRPIAEIQYLDYVLYALQIISDDLATLRWRTRGGQKAPVIIRTRGHRLEGIWHSGSPMSAIIDLMRGIYICVPRDATQAAGFYNTILRSDDPALIVEVLNGYRRKARRPDNIGDFTVPLGCPEVLRKGADVTVVTYGACCAIALEAAELLQRVGIHIELIDVQTLVPFDLQQRILRSLQKTSRILFLDEDFPGGATAYMLHQVLEVQGGYDLLDCAPRTLSAKEHRPAYGSDGDYFSKPNREQIFEAVYALMHESSPQRFPIFYR